MKKQAQWLGFIVSMFCASAVMAADIQINSFVRTGAAMAFGDYEMPYLERIDKNGDTGDTHFGLTISSQLNDNWEVAGQLFSSGAEGGAYEVVLDWAYGTFHMSDEIKMSFGKIKYPNLLVSEFVDVGVSYPWVRPPQEVYAFEAEEGPNMSLEAFNGGTMVYSGFAGDLEYLIQAYAGHAGVDEGQSDLAKMIGGKIKLGTDMFSVQAAYNQHTAFTPARIELNGKDVAVISAGANVTLAGLLMMAEYNAASVVDEATLDTSAYYGTVGYEIGRVMPHVTYAMLEAGEGRSTMTAGMKYQLMSSAVLKLDYTLVMPEKEEGAMEEPASYHVVAGALDFVF